MRNEAGGARSGKGGAGLFSVRALSSYLRIVSSGASTVASTVRSAGASVAASIADHCEDTARDQVHWAGFDKLEYEGNILRQVLLLGYRSGFQVWDVEDADDVRMLASSYDDPVTFLQMQKNPIASKKSDDKFSDIRPLLVVASDGFSPGCRNNEVGSVGGFSNNGVANSGQEQGNENLLPTSVRFYSLRTHEYVHVLRFRSAVYSVRCSPRIVAVLQASQIHCFDAATLERGYTILTSPIVSGSVASGGISYGPLAVGPRWLAYSGSPISVSSTGRVSPQHLVHSNTFPTPLPNGSLVARYAKESSKQLATGIVILGDAGYKLSKYCLELLPDGNSSLKQGNFSFKANGTINGQLPDVENVGTVIVRDIVSKSIVVQFRAHQSPISALCFDPSGTLLVTASVHGHSINVFHVSPPNGGSLGSEATGTCVHLYKLQRGLTNAVIQDISFSDDSQWIMISSSRGTSHLFAISPFGGTSNLQINDFRSNGYGSDVPVMTSVRWSNSSGASKLVQQSLFSSGPPVTLSVVSRIRNGGNGWKGAVTGAAAAATGRVSPLSGAIASTFHLCKPSNVYPGSLSRTKNYLLVFSPSGCIIQYVLHQSIGEDSANDISGLNSVSHMRPPDAEAKLAVEALQKWDICHKRNRRDRSDSVDVYGEHGHGESTKLFHKGIRKGTSIHPTDSDTGMKVKVGTEENNHLYISEVELQTHSNNVPLWTKSEYCFQAMECDNINVGNDSALRGEIEIENIITRTIEVRSKDLVPVCDHFQRPRMQQLRENACNSKRSGSLLHQKYGVSEDGRHSCISSCSSIDCMCESAAVAELPNGIENIGSGCSRDLVDFSEDFVDKSRESPCMKNQLEFVNNGEGRKMEAQIQYVNNKQSPQIEAHFEGNDNID